ncbi:MAG: hypothetical protein ACK5YR_00635 [Pirellula sp.]|jgi:hypothetical protein
MSDDTEELIGNHLALFCKIAMNLRTKRKEDVCNALKLDDPSAACQSFHEIQRIAIESDQEFSRALSMVSHLRGKLSPPWKPEVTALRNQCRIVVKEASRTISAIRKAIKEKSHER